MRERFNATAKFYNLESTAVLPWGCLLCSLQHQNPSARQKNDNAYLSIKKMDGGGQDLWWWTRSCVVERGDRAIDSSKKAENTTLETANQSDRAKIGAIAIQMWPNQKNDPKKTTRKLRTSENGKQILWKWWEKKIKNDWKSKKKAWKTHSRIWWLQTKTKRSKQRIS